MFAIKNRMDKGVNDDNVGGAVDIVLDVKLVFRVDVISRGSEVQELSKSSSSVVHIPGMHMAPSQGTSCGR